MASVKVAVRVRPLNQREIGLGCNFIVDMDGKKTTIQNPRAVDQSQGESAREFSKSFTYDFSYWSVHPSEPKYHPQSQVFSDLGMDVIKSAYEGYNACIFAYGQTGSGKTYTMMGNSNDQGLIPRICEELFARMHDKSTTYRTEVSYLEIYNERVRDLIKTTGSAQAQHSLRVREHPKEGPYVQDLSKHIVMDYSDIKALMDRGNINRTTASTNMNDVSSRSHAIFTINFTQAKFSSDAPSETHSKIHLVDLAGSERADATGATGQRLKEGGSINKSLVTLGNVISALADMSDKVNQKKNIFIPYRDSVLTWLLKDSLGGNAKTIMIAAISPADCNYAETLSTLRYANRAKNIINKPTINEDPNVKLIRELRAEISRLRTLLGGKADSITTPKVQEKLHENEARVKILTEEWAGKWKEVAQIMQEERQLALRKQGLGVVLDSELPHIIGIDDDILSTGIMLYHIKTGKTTIGTRQAEEKQDIVLQGEEVESQHCIIEHVGGEVTLTPVGNALCTVNGVHIEDPVKLSQGAVILLGKTNMFRFNHPEQVAKMRAEFNGSNMTASRFASLSQSMTDLARSTENLALLTSGWEMDQKHREQLEALEDKRQKIEEMEENHRVAEERRLQEQEAKEEELESKKRQLEHMQEEVEALRKETQALRQAMDAERAQLKRRSMDIEKQYQQMLARQQQHEHDKELEIEEKTKLKETLQEEIDRLIKQEWAKLELAKLSKMEVEKELAELLSSKEANLEISIKELHNIEKEMLKRREELAVIKEKDLAVLEKEKEHLERMRKDHEAFYKNTSELDVTAKARLEAENEQVTAAKKVLTEREKALYDAFKKEQDALEKRKLTDMENIQKDWEQLKADKIYLDECEQQFELAMSQMTSDEGRQELEAERVALESEKQRMIEDEQRLEQREKKVNESYETDSQKLRETRDQQVESLCDLREKLKQSEEARRLVLEEEIRKNGRRLQQVKEIVDDGELQIEQLEQDHAAARQAVEAATASGDLPESQQGAALQLQIRQLEEELRKRESRLEELEDGRAIAEAGGDEAVVQLQQRLKEMRNNPQGNDSNSASVSGSTSDSSPEDEEKVRLQQRIMKLATLEQELQRSEEELEQRRLRYEQERQEELDNIDWERFKLQEMEDMERINALVEQEVKRCLLEERVQREKQRRIEREAERVEREQELSKLKRQHEREIQRLKEKYESSFRGSSGDILNTNAPTKANPYASVMTLDHGIISKSRSQQSLDQAGPSQNIHDTVRLDISVPGYRQRGSTLDTHYEFEIKITIGQDSYSIFRRYSKFRELHNDLKVKFPQVSGLVFPPKKWFGNRSEKIVVERRKHLENYLINVLEILRHNPNCLLHTTHNKVYSKQVLHELHPFFRRGLFEVSKHGTA